MTVSFEDIDRFLGEQRWSMNTVDRYRRALEQLFAEVEDPSALDAVNFRVWLESHGWGMSAQWVAYSAVKGYLKWKYGAQHPALSLKIKRAVTPPQRVLRVPQIKDLLASFNTSTAKGRRDLAMCGIFLDTGLRVSEICRLSLRFLYLDEQRLQVIVKGGQWSWRAFSDYTTTWISAWLADRSSLVNGNVDEVFVGVGGNTPGKPMTRHGVQCVVKAWGKQAAIGKLSPHDFRRSMASVATLMGAPEDIVMKGGGWKDHNVFRRYTVGVTADDLRPYFPTSAAMER